MVASSFEKVVAISIYWNPANRKTSAVPRHAEIVDPVASRICKDLGVPRPGE
jgi:hypothetical protein